MLGAHDTLCARGVGDGASTGRIGMTKNETSSKEPWWGRLVPEVRRTAHKVWGSEHRSSTTAVILASASGLLVLWIVKDRIGASGDAVYVAALLLPLLVFAIASGLVTEFKAGGFEAKFRDLARRPVAASRKSASFEEVDYAEKGDVALLEFRVGQLRGTRPVLLVIGIGERRNYSVQDLLVYLDRLAEFRQFLFVVITDASSSVVGYMRPEVFRAAITGDRDDFRRRYLVDLLNEGDAQRLRDGYAHALIQEVIFIGATVRAALARMVELRLNAMLVVTTNRRLVAVAERDLLVAELVLAATDSNSRTADGPAS